LRLSPGPFCHTTVSTACLTCAAAAQLEHASACAQSPCRGITLARCRTSTDRLECCSGLWHRRTLAPAVQHTFAVKGLHNCIRTLPLLTLPLPHRNHPSQAHAGRRCIPTTTHIACLTCTAIVHPNCLPASYTDRPPLTFATGVRWPLLPPHPLRRRSSCSPRVPLPPTICTALPCCDLSHSTDCVPLTAAHRRRLAPAGPCCRTSACTAFLKDCAPVLTVHPRCCAPSAGVRWPLLPPHPLRRTSRCSPRVARPWWEAAASQAGKQAELLLVDAGTHCLWQSEVSN
jgi:hypothetical protein